MKRILPILAMMALAVAARGDAVSDDVPDSTTSAASIVPGAPALSRSIEADADRDCYAFPALPWIDYTITVATGTIGDCEAWFVGADGSTEVRYTNTASGTPATPVFRTQGPATRCHVVVRGLAEITTGTYTIGVASAFPDATTNGLPDDWETQYFGGPVTPGADADGDGISNADEWLMGTSPTNILSALRVVSLSNQVAGTTVGSSTVSSGFYRVTRTIALGNSATWTAVSNATFIATNSLSQILDTTPTTNTSFYRVELLY